MVSLWACCISTTACASVWAEAEAAVDSYSRAVAVFKVLLPLAALAILATLFLLSRSQGIDTAIPYADAELTARVRDLQVTAPLFSGVTDRGEEITVTADTLRPGRTDNPGNASYLTAQIQLVNGRQIHLESDNGRLDAEADTVLFEGNVRIDTSDGLRVLSDALNAELSGIEAETPGPVTATGPIGDLSAGKMQITAKNETGHVHVLFKNGVKLVYDPKQHERQ